VLLCIQDLGKACHLTGLASAVLIKPHKFYQAEFQECEDWIRKLGSATVETNCKERTADHEAPQAELQEGEEGMGQLDSKRVDTDREAPQAELEECENGIEEFGSTTVETDREERMADHEEHQAAFEGCEDRIGELGSSTVETDREEQTGGASCGASRY